MDELMKIVEEGLESEKTRTLAMVEERFESAKRNMLTQIKRYFEDRNRSSPPTNMKLEFRNWIAQKILTGEEIQGEGGNPIEVALVDDSAGDVVKSGPAASADVEIVLLKGKKSERDEGFNSNIVSEVEGKQPILDGNVALQLKKGLGVVKNIKFRHHASKIKPSVFMLGARVVGDCRIKEAKTEPFILKDYRAKYFKKHPNPSLDDEVSRLVCIRRGGKIDRRLQENQIYTVEDFLTQLLINPQGLKTTVKCQGKKWEAIVNNARACLIGQRVYFCMDLEQKVGIIFNILGHVEGLYLGSYYSRTNTLSEEQKADLLASAYANWREVKSFEDRTSLEQHLACLSPYTDTPKPESPGGDQENTAASEVVAESSFTMNLSGVAGDQDFGSFRWDDIDFMYDAVLQLSNAYPCSPIPFDCIDTTGGGGGGGSGGEASRRSRAPNRWRKLVCILRWLIRKERVCRC